MDANEKFTEMMLADSELCSLINGLSIQRQHTSTLKYLIERYCQRLRQETIEGPKLCAIALFHCQASTVSQNLWEHFKRDKIRQVDAMGTPSNSSQEENEAIFKDLTKRKTTQ